MPIDKQQILGLVAEYIDLGWSLIPIGAETKKPPYKWRKYQEERADLDTVTRWIEKGFWLALVTGDISGVLVVDDDRVKHGLPAWGFDSTVISQSKSGGRHYYFEYDREIHQSINEELRIDIKGWHNYVLLAPFGERVWIKEPSFANVGNLPILTDEVYQQIKHKSQNNGGAPKLDVNVSIGVADGNGRRDKLHALACSLFNKLDKEEALTLLRSVNEGYSPPLTEVEFRHNVERAWNFIKSNPVDKGVPVVLIKEKEKTNPLTISKVEDFIKIDYPQHQWLVNKLIRADGLNLVLGEPGVGKSLICLSIVKAVTGGGFWMSPEFTAKKCKVLLIDKENSPVDLQNNIRDFGIEEGVYIYMQAEFFNIIDRKGELTPEAKEVSAFVTSEGIDVIVMDSMIDFFIGSTNDATDVSINTQAWRKVFGNRALIVIHHEGKPVSGGPKRSAKNRALGSVNIVAQANSMLSVSAPDESRQERLVVEHSKVRGARSRQPFEIEMQIKNEYMTGRSMVTGFSWRGESRLPELAISQAKNAVLAFLRLDAQRYYTRKEIRTGLATSGIGWNTIYGAVKALTADGYLDVGVGGVSERAETFKYGKILIDKDIENV